MNQNKHVCDIHLSYFLSQEIRARCVFANVPYDVCKRIVTFIDGISAINTFFKRYTFRSLEWDRVLWLLVMWMNQMPKL